MHIFSKPCIISISLPIMILFHIHLSNCLQDVRQRLKKSSGFPPNDPRNQFQANIIDGAKNADSDSEDYSDDVYYDLAMEYRDNLRSSYEVEGESRNLNSSSAADHQNYDSAWKSERDEKREESYEEMASRLKCDNPWFWNAPKCTWLDVQSHKSLKRTDKNAKTSVWLIGGISVFLILWMCSGYCFYLFKMRNRNRLQKLRKKYTPGRLELPSGKIVNYEPTQEEHDAYEELVKAIIFQEMTLI